MKRRQERPLIFLSTYKVDEHGVRVRIEPDHVGRSDLQIVRPEPTYSVGGPDGGKVSAVAFRSTDKVPGPLSIVVSKRVQLERIGPIGGGSIPPGVYGPGRWRIGSAGAVSVRWAEGAHRPPDAGDWVGIKPSEYHWIEGDHDGAFCPLPGYAETCRIGGDPVEEWAALGTLRNWVDSAGWSLGDLQRDEPTALVFARHVLVPKWRDLSDPERAELDGVVCWIGSPRHGTAVLFIRETHLDAVQRG